MLQRYCKRTMHSFAPCKINENALPKYEDLGIRDWHHCLIIDNLALFYLWDARVIQIVLPVNKLAQEDLTYHVIDNRMDLVCYTTDTNIYEACDAIKYDAPIVFVQEPLEQGELDILNTTHI